MKLFLSNARLTYLQMIHMVMSMRGFSLNIVSSLLQIINFTFHFLSFYKLLNVINMLNLNIMINNSLFISEIISSSGQTFIYQGRYSFICVYMMGFFFLKNYLPFFEISCPSEPVHPRQSTKYWCHKKARSD